MNSDPTENIVRTEHQLLESLERPDPELPTHEVRRLLQEAYRDAPEISRNNGRLGLRMFALRLIDVLRLSAVRSNSSFCFSRRVRSPCPLKGGFTGNKVALFRRSRKLISIGHMGRVTKLHGLGKFSELRRNPMNFDSWLSSRRPGTNPLTPMLRGTHANHHGSHAQHHESPLRVLWNLLQPEWSDLGIVLLFAVVIGVLTLTTPIAVEALVDTVAFGRFFQPVIILSAILLGFLGFNALLLGLQTYVVEIIQRRLFARLAGEIAMKLPRVIQTTESVNSFPRPSNRFLDIVTIQKSTASLVSGERRSFSAP